MRVMLVGFLLSSLVACAGPGVQPQGASPMAPLFQARTAPVQAQAVTTIQAAEAFDWLSDPNATWLVLDVRTPQEYASGHLENAVLQDFYAADFREQLLNMDRHQPMILYCRSGNRSGQALQMMRELGFKNAYDIRGGIQAWQAAGYPVQP